MRTKVFMLALSMLVGGTGALARKAGYVVWVERVAVPG